MVKKAQIPIDYFALYVFILFFIVASLVTSMVLIPMAVERSKAYILQESEPSSDNLFIYGFLRQKFEEGTMADLIAISYMNKEYTKLEQKTIEILQKTDRTIEMQEETEKKACFDIYFNKDKMPRTSKNECKRKGGEFIVHLPLQNKELLNFRLVLYE